VSPGDEPVTVDTNILFSTLLSSHSSLADALLQSDRRFFACEQVIRPVRRSLWISVAIVISGSEIGVNKRTASCAGYITSWVRQAGGHEISVQTIEAAVEPRSRWRGAKRRGSAGWAGRSP
jgi:hypothetical protein